LRREKCYLFGIGLVGMGVLFIVGGVCCALANFPKKLAPVAGLSAALILVGTTDTGFFSAAVFAGAFTVSFVENVGAAVTGLVVATGLSIFNLLSTPSLSLAYDFDPPSFSRPIS